MDTLSYKTISANKATVKKEWVLIDATDLVLGRMCSKVAKLLRGKYKPSFTPNVDCGDNVVIINAAKVKITGNKLTDRIYLTWSGYPGGQKGTPQGKVLSENPAKLIRKVVKGMLPKNKLADQLINNLYVYAGNEHKQEAQQPKVIDLNAIN
ncbi:MAG: 50S ribosomal protein L13 [Paludibacteraceae bacterium]|nr:50S ribosomal protein L13 [Candidatus Physcocola equi]MCQ2233650.1 50S ribosomal protein L13 [Paludibacteraceae bacterium]